MVWPEPLVAPPPTAQATQKEDPSDCGQYMQAAKKCQEERVAGKGEQGEM